MNKNVELAALVHSLALRLKTGKTENSKVTNCTPTTLKIIHEHSIFLNPPCTASILEVGCTFLVLSSDYLVVIKRLKKPAESDLNSDYVDKIIRSQGDTLPFFLSVVKRAVFWQQFLSR